MISNTRHSIRIGVVGDMRRRDEAWELSQDTDADVVCYDDATLGCTGNHIRTWTKLLQRGGDWAVVLEDDAQVCEDFAHQLSMVLADPPADVIGLYLGTGYPKVWQRFIKAKMTSEAHYLMSSHLLHGVGTAIRMWLVPDMLRFIGNLSPTDKLRWPIDEQITHWCRLRGYRVAYTKPSLVEHRDGPTLLDHSQIDGTKRVVARRAWQFGTRPSWDSTSTVDIQ